MIKQKLRKIENILSQKMYRDIGNMHRLLHGM